MDKVEWNVKVKFTGSDSFRGIEDFKVKSSSKTDALNQVQNYINAWGLCAYIKDISTVGYWELINH